MIPVVWIVLITSNSRNEILFRNFAGKKETSEIVLINAKLINYFLLRYNPDFLSKHEDV